MSALNFLLDSGPTQDIRQIFVTEAIFWTTLAGLWLYPFININNGWPKKKKILILDLVLLAGLIISAIAYLCVSRLTWLFVISDSIGLIVIAVFVSLMDYERCHWKKTVHG
jgi:cytochrome c oxidase subunit IV